MVEDETFFAWLDGELSPGKAARVAAEVATDARLSKLAEAHRAMNAGLKVTFGTVDAQPVPEPLVQAILARADSTIVDLGKARNARERRPQPYWVQAAAIAATLVVGVLAGNALSGGTLGGSSTPIKAQDGLLVASGDLENALQTRLASAPNGQGPRIGLTFREKSGAICRTFEDQSVSGFACRESADWRIRSVFQGPEAQTTDYRMAGNDERLIDAVELAIDGEPFDSAREKAALHRGWKK